MKQRLDKALVERGLAPTRSQAESMIKLGQVKVNGRIVNKNGTIVSETDQILSTNSDQYVGRAGLKLASVADKLGLDFRHKTVLDVGSSTGGFTDYALQHGTKKVIAVDVGTDQLHPSLRQDRRIELHEKTDIRDFTTNQVIDIVVADVSFISLREILPSVVKLCNPQTQLAVMVKPQFEARHDNLKHKGVIKNDKLRREILQNFEDWARQHFVVIAKADSDIAGGKGNRERFYLLKPLA
ncbi:TlyA family RNA methyltransferase [Candidatus Saccharibacteria bacterium]|nr:TlyA family RNA methyltransferase [Candidatus Saccharibacteria bacterium]